MDWKMILLVVLVVVAVVGLMGCAGYQSLIKKIPPNEFEEFSYHRGGNVTSCSIVAKNAKKTDEHIEIEEVEMSLNYGPAYSANIRLKGYKRELQP